MYFDFSMRLYNRYNWFGTKSRDTARHPNHQYSLGWLEHSSKAFCLQCWWIFTLVSSQRTTESHDSPYLTDIYVLWSPRSKLIPPPQNWNRLYRVENDCQVSVLGHSIAETQCILNILSYHKPRYPPCMMSYIYIYMYACCQLHAWIYFLKLCLIIIASKSIIALNQKKQNLVNMIAPNFKISLSGTLFPGCLKLQECKGWWYTTKTTTFVIRMMKHQSTNRFQLSGNQGPLFLGEKGPSISSHQPGVTSQDCL